MLEASLVEIKVISVNMGASFRLLHAVNFQRLYASFEHHRTRQVKSVCHAIKMMSDDDTDDCDGLFDRLF